MVNPCCSLETTTAWKKSFFLLLDRSELVSFLDVLKFVHVGICWVLFFLSKNTF